MRPLLMVSVLALACESPSDPQPIETTPRPASPPCAPADRAPDAGRPRSAEDIVLRDASAALTISFDIAHPRVTLSEGGRSAAARAVELVPTAIRTVARLPLGVTYELGYRLRFTIDRCAFESEEALPSAWPGPCGYYRGEHPPERLEPYTLLVSRSLDYYFLSDSTRAIERAAASCVPSSAAGPTCELTGERIDGVDQRVRSSPRSGLL